MYPAQQYPQNAYTQPQATAMPWPIDRLLAPYVQVDPRNPPVMPKIPYLPVGLAPYYPAIVALAVDAIQAKAGQNPLRVFLFNQMSVNSYNNAEFTAFVDGVVRLLDFRLATRVYQDVSAGIADATVFFCELQAVGNTLRWPELRRYIDPQMAQGVDYVLGVLRTITADLMRHTEALQQGRVLEFGAAPAQPMGYVPPVASYGQPVATGYIQPQGGATHGPALSPVGATIGASPFYSGAAPAAPSNVNAPADDARFARLISSPYDTQPPAPAGAVSPAANVQEMRRLKEQQMTQTTIPINRTPGGQESVSADAGALPANYVVATPDVKWVPSRKVPINIAYNPNTTDLIYSIAPDGTTAPFIKKKENEMDINKHLVVPSYANVPLGTGSLDTSVRAFEANAALAELATTASKAKPAAFNVSYRDDTFDASMCLSQLWFNNELQLALMHKRDGKTNMHRSCGVLLDSLVSEKNPKPFLDMLQAAENFGQAAVYLKKANDQINTSGHEHLDARLLTLINNRLTHAVNEFLKTRLAVPLGWITSFMDDAPLLLGWFDKKYGETSRKAIESNQGAIVRDAVMYAQGDFDRDESAAYLPDEESEEGKEARKLTVTHFYSCVMLTSLDLFSVELAMEIPTTEISSGLFQEQTPLMRQLAENVFTHERALNVAFGRFLVRTADGVVLELSKSAAHADFYLVRAVSA